MPSGMLGQNSLSYVLISFLWVWLTVKSSVKRAFKWEHIPIRLVCRKVCEAEILYLMCIGGFSWMFVWISFACLVPAVTKEHISWKCNYALLQVTVWVQIIKSLSSEKIIGALSLWAMYPAPIFTFYQGNWAQELTGYTRSKKICNSLTQTPQRGDYLMPKLSGSLSTCHMTTDMCIKYQQAEN